MTSITCECGHQMHRHGSRSVMVRDHHGDQYIDLLANIQRFRCPSCASTNGVETPEIEQGFKITKAAAEKIIDTALHRDIQACSEISGVDKSTISRLLSSKADELLLKQPTFKTCRLKVLRPSLLALLNQSTHEAIGFLPGGKIHSVANILERLGVETVIPCPEIAPHAFSWRSVMSVTLTANDFATMVSTLLRRAALKMIGTLKLPDSVTASTAANLLSSDLSRLSVSENIALSKLAPAGTPARGFMRMRDRLLAVHNAPDLTTARTLLSKWKEDCRDTWRTVFSGVLRFLETYKDMILTNPYSLQPAASYSVPAALRPANIMTIQLHRSRPTSENTLTLHH